MKQKQFLPKFTAANCTVNDNTTQLAMHFGAGTVDKEAFESAAEHNVAVVGGTDSVRELLILCAPIIANTILQKDRGPSRLGHRWRPRLHDRYIRPGSRQHPPSDSRNSHRRNPNRQRMPELRYFLGGSRWWGRDVWGPDRFDDESIPDAQHCPRHRRTSSEERK